MAIPQTSVSAAQGFGIPGEFYTNQPFRVDSYTINSASAAYNVFGRACTVVSEGVARVGNPSGTAVFAGYLVCPKEQALYGTSGVPLAPTLTIPNQTVAEVCSMGNIVVTLDAAAAIGNVVIYDNTTGILSTIAPGADLPSGKSPGFAVVTQQTVAGAGLAVITITQTPGIPVPAALENAKLTKAKKAEADAEAAAKIEGAN
jgi:hypothetical protein